MQLTITARHEEIPDSLKERAAVVAERLGRLAHRPTATRVTFDMEGPKASCEILLTAARDAVHVAKACAADHRTALDRVAAKLRRQLDKAGVRPARQARRSRTASR